MESEVPEAFEYWAFISYSAADTRAARWLHRAIESYGIPTRLVGEQAASGITTPKRLKPVFRDRDELPASADLRGEIAGALEASRFLIVLCSPHAARSSWVNREVETFRALGRGNRIFAVIVAGEPNSGDDEECFPPALRDSEPLAADLRVGRDGKANARLKLVAGMLGVGFDALRQRDAQKRIRRAKMIASAAVALAAVFAGLTVYAQYQRTEAVEARERAEQFVSYMMTDLMDELAPIGRLDIVESVQREVAAYYELSAREEGNQRKLLNRARTLRNQARILEARGDLVSAEATKLEALATLKQCAEGGSAHEQCLTEIAEIYYSLSASEDRGAEFARDGLAIVETLLDQNQHDSHYRMLAGKGQLLVGMTAPTSDERLAALNSARDTFQSLALTQPSSSRPGRGLVMTHGALALFYFVHGDDSMSLEHMELAVSTSEDPAARFPNDLRVREEMALNYRQLSAQYLFWGNAPEAVKCERAALAVVVDLAEWDPENPSRKYAEAASRSTLGCLFGSGIFDETQDVPAAVSEYERARDILTGLVAFSPENEQWVQELESVEERLRALGR
jgi:hypothetical protein